MESSSSQRFPSNVISKEFYLPLGESHASLFVMNEPKTYYPGFFEKSEHL